MKLLVGSLASLLAMGAGAAAADDPAVTITSQIGFESRYVEGLPVPASITIESSRAIAGKLWVAGGSSAYQRSHSMSVEIPAGGKKRFDLVAPGDQPLVINLFDQKGKRLASSTKNLVPLEGTLVGTIGKLPSGLRGLSQDESQNPVVPTEIVPEWLELGTEILKPLHYLIVESSDARALPPRSASNLRQWIASGGRMIVAGSESLDWLPESWRTVGPGEQEAGLGRVSTLANADSADQQQWRSILRPYGRLFGTATESSDTPDTLVAQSLTSSGSGVRLRWLIVFVLLYLALAGPISYRVLSGMQRKELLWVTVPALSLLFALAGLVLARGNRAERSVKQAVVVLAQPDASFGRQLVISSAASGGRQTLGFSPGYATEVALDFGFEDRPATTEITSSGTQVILETSAFEYGMAAGPVSGSKGYLDADLVWDGKGFFGSVTNRTPYEFSQVSVVIGGDVEPVGRLSPGKSERLVYLPSGAGQASTSNQLSAFQRTNDPQSLREGLIRSFDAMVGNDYPLGFPYVAGITEDFRPKLTVEGKTETPRSTALIATPIKLGVAPGLIGRLPSAAGSAELLRISRGGGYSSQSSSFYGGGGFYSPRTSLQLSSFSEAVFVTRLPKSVPRDRITSASLYLTALPGGGFAGPPPPPQAVAPPNTATQSGSATIGVPGGVPGQQFTLRVEVFDWSQRKWAGLDSTAIAGGVPISLDVISSEGEVLVKVLPSQYPEISIQFLGVEAVLS